MASGDWSKLPGPSSPLEFLQGFSPLNKIKVEKVCVRHKAEFPDSQGDKDLNELPRDVQVSLRGVLQEKKKKYQSLKASVTSS